MKRRFFTRKIETDPKQRVMEKRRKNGLGSTTQWWRERIAEAQLRDAELSVESVKGNAT